MDREIKFRAWVHRQLLKDEMLYYELGQVPPWLRLSDPLMQFTGLKDKNGVEIYEGDIVKTVDEHWDEKNTELHSDYGIVRWNDTEAGFWVDDDDRLKKPGCSTIGSPPLHAGYEVIGNIYENPELLEKNMNRKIVFRAWDKKDKKMHNVVQVIWGNQHSKVPLSVDFYDSIKPRLFEDVELMEFTGLYDKNGTPIFEGDICENGDWEEDAHCYRTWKDVVKWQNGDAGFSGTYQNEDGMKCEVIGNIYEHSHLLNK